MLFHAVSANTLPKKKKKTYYQDFGTLQQMLLTPQNASSVRTVTSSQREGSTMG